ncbi:hypothetical protein [Pedobacter sp. ASV28]|uniref:hypothetical protein n=1 Tax=Pedobacter sp. ASV28 TaxID=2795123 RepID=UPI0018EAB3C1|nr:hypothetical protein [Pedobacter sp. ASV28]
MKKIKGLIFLTILIMVACSPKISTKVTKSYPALDYNQEVIILGVQQEEPKDAELLGEIKIGDSGFSTKCSYETVIENAKLEARKIGGNVVKLTQHKTPSVMGSSCHRIAARILKAKSIEALRDNQEELVLNVDYALLHIYRYGGMGSLVGYNLYLGDSIICRVKNNFKTTLQIKKDGLNTLWAKTESKAEVPIDLKPGKQYYLRCGINMGALVGRPLLELVDSRTGKAEFDAFKAKNQ